MLGYFPISWGRYYVDGIDRLYDQAIPSAPSRCYPGSLCRRWSTETGETGPKVAMASAQSHRKVGKFVG